MIRNYYWTYYETISKRYRNPGIQKLAMKDSIFVRTASSTISNIYFGLAPLVINHSTDNRKTNSSQPAQLKYICFSGNFQSDKQFWTCIILSQFDYEPPQNDYLMYHSHEVGIAHFGVCHKGFGIGWDITIIECAHLMVAFCVHSLSSSLTLRLFLLHSVTHTCMLIVCLTFSIASEDSRAILFMVQK